MNQTVSSKTQRERETNKWSVDWWMYCCVILRLSNDCVHWTRISYLTSEKKKERKNVVEGDASAHSTKQLAIKQWTSNEHGRLILFLMFIFGSYLNEGRSFFLSVTYRALLFFFVSLSRLLSKNDFNSKCSCELINENWYRKIKCSVRKFIFGRAAIHIASSM